MTDQLTETWRPVVGYEGSYEVSSHGRIRRLARTVIRKNGIPMRIQSKMRTLSTDRSGYQIVSLPVGSKSRRKYVHHIVLDAFVGLRPPHTECRHLDGNPQNNRLENLAWGTASENAHDRVRHGTHYWAANTHCKRGHEFTPENTYEEVVADGRRKARHCRACIRVRNMNRGAS